MHMKRNRSRWLFPLFPIAAVALFSLVVMLLWNAIIPGLIGWTTLTYWKAMGLLVLSKVLFSGFPCRRGGHPGPPWAQGRHAGMRMAWWRNLTEEEREQLKERHREWRTTWEGITPEERARNKEAWKARCGGGQPGKNPA